jgi:hypothetical protein
MELSKRLEETRSRLESEKEVVQRLNLRRSSIIQEVHVDSAKKIISKEDEELQASIQTNKKKKLHVSEKSFIVSSMSILSSFHPT